jgi:hypothetical protein
VSLSSLSCRPARATLAPALAAIVLASLPGAAGAGRDRRVARVASTRFQVTQVEYRLLLSHSVITAGPVDLAEIDRGHEQHDLRLRSESGGGEIRGKLLRPGSRWEGTVYLKPGTYKLWCSLPEHAKYGMHATLRVIR